MSFKHFPFILIPAVLTIAVLAVTPQLIHKEGPLKGISLALIAGGFPWFLYVVISVGIKRSHSKDGRNSRSDEDGFV